MGFKFLNTFDGKPVGDSLCGGPLGGPFTGGVNLPNGQQVHFHGSPDLTTITGSYNTTTGQFLNGYESSMLELVPGATRWTRK
ncbi:hypothetical protein [Pseudodesulfovibrio sp.]|uniref:hypothetical protein n=1 Tax=Pseudodesulfovibrio sp. TaxID=2035812 RepID=UPI002607A678|nr:hypothetical protein [Pseudodesulfovibrio sp.]MDD3311016.1 hypothetical protein [Pseudodesulfovibrio sp.]